MLRPLVFISIAVLFLFNCSEKAEKSGDQSLIAFADSLFQVHVDSSHIAGASVMVMRKGKVLLHKSYGFADLEFDTPMPVDASFEIGSVTKQFTAAAILKLVEAGKLSLADDFTKYVDFDTKGRKITINQLLNHTSGIASYTEIPEFGAIALQSYQRDTLLRLVETKDFLFEPGEAMIYNNTAYFLLGLIIEKASGKKYEEYLDEQFFKPLGMQNTYYSSTKKVIKKKAYGYDYTPEGLQQKAYLDHTWPYSAGSLSSTTADLSKWMTALHGGELLNNDLYQSLITPDTLNDGTPIRYAKGLAHYNNLGNEEISHGGGIPGYLSETKYFPGEDLHIICLVNTMGPQGAGFFADQLMWKLLEKQDYASMKIEDNLQSIDGKYKGQARGSMLSAEINVMPEGLRRFAAGQEKADTLKVYIGNGTWMDGNTIISIKNGEYREDQVYGYFLLMKEN